MGSFSVGGIMKIRKNKKGFYEEDKDMEKEWLLLLVVVVIAFIGFSIHFIKTFF